MRDLEAFRSHRAAAFAAACAALLSACPAPDPGEDGGVNEPRPDACNSLDEALNQPDCALTLGEKRQAYLSFAGDQDWYSFTTPANANARTLLHVVGGYPVANTAVNLSFNILRSDGQSSVARKSDRHGQAAPKPVDITVPFAEANQKLVILVADDPVNPTKPNFDVRAQYELTADVLQDPDVNEPNDTMPTPIPLTAMGNIQEGTQTGYLSTTDDVDTFSIAGGGPKKILYLHITGPELTPPANYLLSYELKDSSGAIVAGDVMQNQFLPVELATARLALKPPYVLSIKGIAPGGATGPVPGDLRLQYSIDVRVVDETDPSEGAGQNDTIDTATKLSIGAPGQSANASGRLGYAGDADWFAVQLSASNNPTVLHYRETPGTGPARFPPLPGFADRQVRVLQVVQTGGSEQDDRVACKSNDAVCPTSYGNDPFFQGLQNEQCNASPPRCLWSFRSEAQQFDQLRNFEGTIPVPPHSAPVTYLFEVTDQGQNFADDIDYSLALDWRGDPDDTARASGGVEQPQQFTLPADPGASGFPHPPMGGAYEFSGKLSSGHGYLRDNNPNDGDGIRGPNDYDAVPSDRDRFEITLPALDPAMGPLDRTWELEWEVAKLPDGGAPPYDLALELEFCDGDNLSGGMCTPVKVGSQGDPLTLSYTGEERNAWHNPSAGSDQRQTLYDRSETASAVVTTANAYGCYCFEPRFIKGGKFFVNTLAVDRSGYEDVPYTVRMAYTDYPKSYTNKMGAQVSCPIPDAGTPDGGPPSGCWFTREP